MLIIYDLIIKFVIYMNVKKSKGINALIGILDQIYDHDSVREIQQRLGILKDGESLSSSQVTDIFIGPTGNWADFNPKSNDPHKVIKIICASIKHEMFK